MDRQEKKTVYQQQPGTGNENNPTGGKTTQEPDKQTLAQNPNPRANENLQGAPFDTGNNPSQQAGSEITDGEDG